MYLIKEETGENKYMVFERAILNAGIIVHTQQFPANISIVMGMVGEIGHLLSARLLTANLILS